MEALLRQPVESLYWNRVDGDRVKLLVLITGIKQSANYLREAELDPWHMPRCSAESLTIIFSDQETRRPR